MPADLDGPLHPSVTLHVLEPGQTIKTTAGHAYGFDAKVKDSHSKADIFTLAANRGLRIAGYGEGPDESGYRRVVVVALAVNPGELPWSLPAPASWFDDSGLVEATEEDNPSAAQADVLRASGAPTPASVATSSVPGLSHPPARWGRTLAVGAALLGGAAIGEHLARRRRARRS